MHCLNLLLSPGWQIGRQVHHIQVCSSCCRHPSLVLTCLTARGVAKFEHYCAEKDIEGVSFDVLSKLYEDPNNLDALPNDKLKLLARSMIQQTMDER